jgi:putative ABC transport system permease protein
MESLAQDVRYGVRGLLSSIGFITVVALSLALGIGANSTIFSVLNAMLYRPLPYEHPERLVAIWQTAQAHAARLTAPPIAELNDWKQENHSFEDIALTSPTQTSSLSGTGMPEPIQLQYVTPTFFNVLGVKPILGRVFLQEDLHDKAQTIVISNSYWKRRFNGDPGVLGKTFTIQGMLSTVVGVMPPGFAPFYGDSIDVWWPINSYSARYAQRIDHWLMPVGRLGANVSIAQAQQEMDVIARRLEQAYPATNKGVGKRLISLQQQLFQRAGRNLYLLLGAVGFILLIACVNVACLMQSRTEGRRKEYAVRAALGAGRLRLVQQLLTESVILALLGGVLGVAVNVTGIALFRKLASNFPNSADIRIDGRVLLFTLGISVLTAVLFGVIPALHASRPDLNLALQEGDRRTSSGSRSKVRHCLVVSEVALAMVLLVGAGLMINTVLRLQQVNPGFDPRNILTMQIQLPAGGKYLTNVPGRDMGKVSPRVPAFYKELLEKVSSLPGVESAATVSLLPTHGAEYFGFSILGHPLPPPDQKLWAGSDEVSPEFFRTLKIPLKSGRYLDEHDTQNAPWSVLISETFARRYFQHEDPIGQKLLLTYGGYQMDEEQPRTIVGVVGDVKHFGMAEEAPPFLYVSYLQQPEIFPGGAVESQLHQTLVLRTTGELSRNTELASSVRKAVAALDPDQPVTDVATMDEALAASMNASRFYMRLLVIFASIAELLAAIGIYGVTSYFVNERTHEIGIRLALGATPSNVVTLVGKLGIKLTLSGVAIGAGLALGLTRLIAGFLYGITPGDPPTYLAVGVVLVGIALFASYLPARRASRVDPMLALRYE